jgi:hypothetical protein
MRQVFLAAVAVFVAGCANRYVTGTKATPPEPCNDRWVARIDNPTDRYYDLYVGTRIVGTAEPRTSNRIVLDPTLGRVTPSLRESATTRDQTGPRISSQALRMSCEP